MSCLEQACAALQAILLNLCRLFCRLLSIVLVFLRTEPQSEIGRNRGKKTSKVELKKEQYIQSPISCHEVNRKNTNKTNNKANKKPTKTTSKTKTNKQPHTPKQKGQRDQLVSYNVGNLMKGDSIGT